MIQEISTYAANPAFCNSVLPRAAECGPNGLAAHRLHGPRPHRCRTSSRDRRSGGAPAGRRIAKLRAATRRPIARWDCQSRCGEGFDAGHRCPLGSDSFIRHTRDPRKESLDAKLSYKVNCRSAQCSWLERANGRTYASTLRRLAGSVCVQSSQRSG